MQTYKLLAMLLDYPGSEIVGDLRAAVSEQGGARGLVRSVDTDKVFTDVERLCNVHIPAWLATEGMGRAKIEMFLAAQSQFMASAASTAAAAPNNVDAMT